MIAPVTIKVFVLLLLYVGLSFSDWATVGKSYSFVCTFQITQFSSIIWLINDYRSIFLCDSFDKECYPASNEILDLYNASITSDSSNFTSVFTIKSVVTSQHNTTWYCIVELNMGVSITSENTLYVLAPPKTPVCLNATLVDEVNINLQCVTEQVFPPAICAFFIRTNNTEALETINGLITYQTKLSTMAGYNRTECIYTVSAWIIGPGDHAFYVVMYPNISSVITEEMKKISQSTYPVKLGYPEAALAADCEVNVYIKENQNRTCTCYDKSQPFLATQVTWSNEYTLLHGRLEFLSKRSATGDTVYTCSISNKLNWTNQITYEPKITYGPDDSFLTLFNMTIDQCDNIGANISGTCTISDCHPDPLVYIYVSNSQVTALHKISSSQYHFSQIVYESGIVYVMCRAENPVFVEISSEIINSIIVKGPPSTPQISSVSSQVKTLTKGNQLQVTEGNTDIVCESKGGFPLYKNLTLICGTHRVSNENSDTISMTLSISRDMQGMNCTCVVGHESKCLHNFVTAGLNILKDEEGNVGAIVGGIVAAVVCVGLIITVIVFIVRRRSKYLATNSQVTNVNKMQTYSNVEVSEDYSNSEMHEYEHPSLRPDPSIETELHKLTDIRQPKMKLKSDACSLGGFIAHDGHTQGRFAEDNTDIKAHDGLDVDADVKQEQHHYEEIDDIIVISCNTNDNRTELKYKPNLNSP